VKETGKELIVSFSECIHLEEQRESQKTWSA